MTILILSILIDEWDELNLSLHIIQSLKGQVDVGVLGVLLEVDQLFEGHVSREVS